ncbi:MAG: glycosyltransferase family 1 protein [Polaromonas sp.]|nr:glycosyltransferase family 1 protein [Polaromonas sp.]
MTLPGARMRIAVLNRSFSPTAGGAERYSMALVEQLAARHEVHVFAQDIYHRRPGVTYHPVSMPLRKPRWINQLWFAAVTWWRTRTGFDVVHSHENTWHGNVQTVHVLPVRHTLFEGRSGFRRVLRWVKVLTSPRLLTYLALERARYAPVKGRAVVVISPSLRDIFLRAYPRAAAMTSLITPGIDLPVFPVGAPAREAARRELHIPLEARCLLFVGNDFRKKGLATLIEAMKMLPKDTLLMVVGDSAQLPAFQRQAELGGLQSRIRFLGALPDVGVAYRAADCLVHPTLEDTFAMVVLEAMAHGLPVLVSGVAYCGIAGLLHDGIDALLLSDPKDAGALASMLGGLLADASQRQRLGLQGRIFATTFDWAGIAARQEALYRSLLQDRAA